MIGQPLCAVPIAARITPAAVVSTDDFRLVDILCRFVAATAQTARFAPEQAIAGGVLLPCMIWSLFKTAVMHTAFWRPDASLVAIFQPEEP